MIGQTSRDCRRRGQQQAQGLQTEREHVASVQPAAMQNIDDEDEGYRHEQEQLTGILDITRSPDSAPDPQPQPSPAPQAAQPAPAPELQPVPPAPAAAAHVPAPEPQPVPLPADAAAVPTGQVPAAPMPQVVVRQGFIPWRMRSVWEWIFALVGALIGFGVSRASNHWITHSVFKCPNGAGYYVVAILWLLILIALGFFLGGLLGSYINRWTRTRRITATPAPAAVPPLAQP